MSNPFPVNTNRFDPYKNYRFLVHFDTSASPVAGVNKISGIEGSSDVIEYREGGDPNTSKSPGRNKYEAITLERGITFDPAFQSWADSVTAREKLRKEIWIVFLNEESQAAERYLVHRCWVSEYQALPDLDTGANAVAVQHLTLENEGWERDTTVTEPAET